MIIRVTILLIIILGGIFLIYNLPKPQKLTAGAAAVPTGISILGEEIAPSHTAVPSVTGRPTNTPTRAPKKTGLKLGIVADDYVTGGSIVNLENTTGKKFETVSIYKQFGNSNNFFLNDVNFIKAAGKKLMIAWEPWNPAEGTNQTRDWLAEINTGKQDDYINKFAQEAKNYGSPISIRFGHEMNGNWYPWGNRPEEFKSAYIRIHDRFKNLGVTNVKWLWSINADNVPYSPITQANKYYPGGAYVDAVGLDGFNFGTSRTGGTWRSFEEIFGGAYKYASSLGKPIILSEIGSSEAGGNKAAWISDMSGIIKQKMPNIGEIIWFNLNKETDWRIESSPASLTAWKLAF